ncbi:MAG: NTP transferase domain-containing protein [Planctomycetota bacterium]|jgi:bifunctional UDP-N-acetylglucosamine pyrophosphorylase/glucosamine-1-phosphate N-acetyltransferase
MKDRSLAAIVLAAGQGKRMGALVPKVLIEACGKTLVEHVLAALEPLGASPVVVVYGHGGDLVKEALDHRGLRFAHQPEQRGTGHATQCGLSALEEDPKGDVLVVCGDTPLLTTEALAGLVEEHCAKGRALTVLSAELPDPGQLGRILRDPATGRLRAIREAADADAEEMAIREINTGVMTIALEHLGGALARLTADNVQSEFYLTDLPGLLLADGLEVGAFMTADTGAALGVNNPDELTSAERLMRERALERFIAAGVEFEDPGSVLIDAGVAIGAGTRIGAGVRIGADARIGLEGEGRVMIGADAVLGAGVVIESPATVGARALVESGTVLVRGSEVPPGDDSHA